MFKKNVGTALYAALLIMPLAHAPATHAEEGARVENIDGYLCRDIMRMSGEDRTIAMAVLHGYMLGKKGAKSFVPDELSKVSNDFIEYCLDHPSNKALETFAKFAK